MTSKNSKLRTILFADIAGYTALMEKDEPAAMDFLKKFKEELEGRVSSFDGRIVQYFGDACLLSFESTSQAVRCSMELQRSYQDVGLPIRMGMHLGEVQFTETNVYGDGVNLASRIESMGVPGGILVSKTVRDQVRNKSEFELTSLGTFDFKNVAEPMEVFAIANEGFTIPTRHELKGKFKGTTHPRRIWTLPVSLVVLFLGVLSIWLIMSSSVPALSEEDKNKPVAVLPFENQTMDAQLDPIGLMTMDWISKGLLEGAEATVIKGEQNEAALSSWKEWAAAAQILIRGRYYSRGESEIVFTADIVDAATDKVLFSLDPMIGKRNDPLDALIALQQKVIGYWKLNGSYPGKPPRYDAYKTYIEAIELHEALPYEKSIPLMEVAQSLDSTFAEPLFSLYYMYRYSGMSSGEESVMDRLRTRASAFSPYHQMRLKALEARYRGDLVRTAEIEWQIYQSYKLDRAAESAITNYCFSNHLQKTIDLYESFEPVTPDTVVGYAFCRYVTALYGLGRYQDVIHAFDTLTFSPSRMAAIIARLQSLIRLDRMEELDSMMDFYKVHPLEHFGWESYSHLHAIVCATLYLKDRDDLLPKYLEAALDWMEHRETRKANLAYLKGVMYFIAGEYQKAYDSNMEVVDQNDLPAFQEVAGVSLIKMGRPDEVDPFIDMLKSRYVTGFTAYSIGVIEAYRNPDEAIKWLKISASEAVEWDFWNFRNDAMLKVIRDHPDFIALTAPK